MVLMPLSKMTDVYEGSLIRMFRRLEELLRQMAQAAKVMGSDELEKKFEDSLSKVKRGGLLEKLNVRTSR
jgi:ATP-dependent RNA helicase DOB1